ncbi:pseudouridylate synthase I [Archaeoglobus sulfaticallidus PM70-1]|uniref:tRNA pseudouridine synthase A n=1 Tax=Archaeoglobus sulfaticallidus PM70-1 TaxID=387631 RepID=N0BNF8_9EURY|nr:tRNA pseudouridine(38-40) synthase TruA [Archaeoglobus sulfaticallidus]AGK61850.1 pseudouridylate synthase I [Archaeoglobus sulfaticallidus PM70-1]
MRVAYKFAYFGDNFHGSQYQPNLRTVEGELFKAFSELGIDAGVARYRCSSRTDAGVHALGNVFAIDVDAKKYLPRIINSKLPEDITIWAWAKVSDDFDPRRDATSRVYSYVMLKSDIDVSLMRKAACIIEGTHDFSNFTKRFAESSSNIRTIKSVEVRLDDRFITIEIEGNAFTWNMVRNLATALEMIGRGVRDVEWMKSMLDPENYFERMEPSPAYGLLLKDVKYSDIEFEIDEYAFNMFKRKLEQKIRFYGTQFKVFSIMDDFLDDLTE